MTRLLVSALAVAALAACSDEVKDGEATGEASATDGSATAAPTTTVPIVEPEGAVRVPIDETGTATMPPGSVLEIRVPAAWGDAAAALRCTVTDGTGRNEDLHSSEVKKREEAGGQEWMTLWTFSAAPNAELTVGCADPERRVPPEGQPFVRVVPRSSAPPAAR
ncbi:hypothetical protein [Nocardia asteroides]|uniref:hypothetical protein n=1 Tax=Nocardia asteroides TaxID=1824 RepID=UPI001E4CE413|nr:hypothetical protein [Nocardia asteroides]UGT63971.1 hypothetical protein LTT61_11975 [Nocardia asteroides]